MKPKLFLGCVMVAILAGCSGLGRNEQGSSSPRATDIHKALNRTVIPEVDLENMTADEALRVWSEKSREFHPLHFKFQYSVVYPMTFSQGTLTTSVAPQSMPKVTVRRRQITSKRLLDEICGEANLQWTIMGRMIVVRPRTTPAEPRP